MEACFENLQFCTAADTRAQQHHGRCFGRSTGLDLNLLRILWGVWRMVHISSRSLPVKIIICGIS